MRQKAAQTTPPQDRNPFLYIEFFLLCIALPSVIIIFRFAPYMFTFLWGATLYCAFVYKRHFFTNWKDLWRWDQVNWITLKPILIRWVIASIAMLAFTALYDPQRLFYLPQEKPTLLPYLLIMYPLLSALPQEFIFCTFFFDRYKAFFTTQTKMILASAIVFAFAHVLFINPVAPIISFFGGLIFASTYAKTKSLALVTIEHGLYGNVLFIVGLGWYFYGGALAG